MAELNGEKVYQKLDLIDGKVDELLIWKATHVQAHEALERDVADHRSVLFENPGVIEKLNTLWNCKSSLSEYRRFWLDILKYVIITIVVATITWLLMIYRGS